jgi:histidinol-phosphate aminotransferase
LANINNVENKEVLLSTDFEPQVDAILDAVTKNAFLCSNNQPNSFSDENVVSLLQWISGYR